MHLMGFQDFFMIILQGNAFFFCRGLVSVVTTCKEKKKDQNNIGRHRYFNLKNSSNEKAKTTGTSQQNLYNMWRAYTVPGISEIQLIPCGGLQEVYADLGRW
jgi:hypothetical protein